MHLYYFLYKEESKKAFDIKLLSLIKSILKSKLNYSRLNEQIDFLNKDNSFNSMLELFDFKKFIKNKNDLIQNSKIIM